MNSVLASLAKDLSMLVAKQAATTVQTKVKALRSVKDADKVRATYDQLLNDLLEDLSQALRIAQAYRDEVEKVEISNSDIEHLHKTVERLLEIIKQHTNTNDSSEAKEQLEGLEQIKELISVDTLKTMQLLGFNYKKAIGEPLTIMLRNYILSYSPSVDSIKDFQKVISPEMVEILKNKTAFDNFNKLLNSNNKNG